jgi:hypothetical protein
MSSQYGYDIYIDGLILPITPGEITTKVGSNNDTVTLINEGEINILKSPSLTEISFDARFPMRKFPYSREPLDFDAYYRHFIRLKTNKKPFQFIVSRRTLKGIPTWYTDMEMALEDLEVEENADEGDDVIVSFTLKQYRNYGVKTLAGGLVKPVGNNITTSDSEEEYTLEDTPPRLKSEFEMTDDRIERNTPVDTWRRTNDELSGMTTTGQDYAYWKATEVYDPTTGQFRSKLPNTGVTTQNVSNNSSQGSNNKSDTELRKYLENYNRDVHRV